MNKTIYMLFLLIYELILCAILQKFSEDKIVKLLVGICPIAMFIIGAIAK